MIPKPAIERLCRMYHFLGMLKDRGTTEISSAALGDFMGIKPHTIRKDISYLETETGNTAGYDVAALREKIHLRFGFEQRMKGCIVGLGRLGSALLTYMEEKNDTFEIAAGFDSSINRMELLKTEVPLYPAYEIPDRVAELEIRVAVLTVPAEAAQITADRLYRGGIRGIINFAPLGLQNPENVIVRNVYLLDEMRIASALIRSAETNMRT